MLSAKLVEIGLVILEKTILKFRQCVSAFSLSAPLGIARDLLFDPFFPFSQGDAVLSLFEIGAKVLEKILKFC